MRFELLRAVCVVGTVLTLSGTALAQSRPIVPLSAARPLSIPGEPAQRAYVLDRRGSRVEAPPPLVRYQSEVLKTDETLDAFLARHHLVMDPATLTMFRSLNPDIDPGARTLPAGKKINTMSVVAASTTPVAGQRYTFDTPNFSGLAFHAKSRQASVNLARARKLKVTRYTDADLQHRHVQSLTTVSKASVIFESRAAQMSSLDHAVAQYQLAYANRLASQLNRLAADGSVTTQQVQQAEKSAERTDVMARRVMQGEPAMGARPVRVEVVDSKGEDVKELAVYVFPGGMQMVDLGQADTEMFLANFSFTNDTSPVTQDVPTDFDARICVGPKNWITGMATLIREQRATTCRKLHFGTSAEPLTVTFTSPADVAKP